MLPGDRDVAAQWAERLLTFADRLTLALDIGEHVGPRLGLEAIFIDQPPAGRGWADLLDTLVGQGLCDPAKVGPFLAWSGQTTPLDSRAAWPDPWIQASLLRPAHQFGTIERQLSHVKISLSATRAPEAKAYLWFAHRWLEAGPAASVRRDVPG